MLNNKEIWFEPLPPFWGTNLNSNLKLNSNSNKIQVWFLKKQAILRKRAADPKAYANVSKQAHEQARSKLADKLKDAANERTGANNSKEKGKKGKK